MRQTTAKIAAAAVMLSLSGGIAAAEVMSGADIRREITGKRIYLATPLGGELPLFYRRGGKVDGSGEAIGLGRYLAPTDSGRWWVRGNNLCQQWQEWYDGVTQCFVLTRTGENRIRWKRNDGLTGTARIGR